MSTILFWCQRVNESSVNSKAGLVEIIAWCQHGTIPVLESVLTKIPDKIAGHYKTVASDILAGICSDGGWSPVRQ